MSNAPVSASEFAADVERAIGQIKKASAKGPMVMLFPNEAAKKRYLAIVRRTIRTCRLSDIRR